MRGPCVRAIFILFIPHCMVVEQSSGYDITGYDSPIGRIVTIMDADTIVGVRFDDGDLSHPPPEHICEWFDAYFSGRRIDPLPKYRLDGISDFARSVYEELVKVPYGHVCTYGRLAEKISQTTGKRVSARAVGMALSRNHVLIILPCHRVIGSDGRMTGYAGGIWRKEFLLSLEKSGSIRSRPRDLWG